MRLKERCSIIIFCSLVLCFSLHSFCVAASVQTRDKVSSVEKLAEGKAADINIPSETLQKARQKQGQVENAKQKDKEALAAHEKIALVEQTMQVDQEKAMVTEQKLEKAYERAAVAESKTGRLQNSTYTKLFQTGLIIVGGYARR